MSGRHHSTILATILASATGMFTVAAIGAALLGPALAEEGAFAASPETQPEIGTDDLATNHEDFSNVLPLLLTSPERKQIAADLEAAIRQGDLKAAESRLNAAIEMGTLAIVLIDRLHDPSLLSTLQSLSIDGDATPSPSPVPQADETVTPAACIPADPTGMSNLFELQEALDREQAHSSTVSQKLAELTQEYEAVASRRESEAAAGRSEASGLQKALEEERQRRESSLSQLASLQEEYRALQTLKEKDASSAQARISELEARVQEEQARSEATTHRIAGMQEELRTLQELKEKESESAASRIAELQDALAREKVRGDALTHELADAIEELRATQEQAAREEPGATPLMFRMELSGMQPHLPSAQEETLPQAPPVAEATPLQPAIEPAEPATGAPAPSQDPRPAVTASLPEATPSLPPVPSPAEPEKTASVPEPGGNEAASPPSPKTDDRLVLRADELFRTGDISGARLLLERSMEDGNPRAAFLLAETFDPQVLSRMGTFGIRGDAAKARELYAKAKALGIAQAGERIEALKK